jgi:hypothetical protein
MERWRIEMRGQRDVVEEKWWGRFWETILVRQVRWMEIFSETVLLID